MLTSLDFLKQGAEFPPKCERNRLDMYAKNKLLFESEHAAVYERDLKRIERVIGNFDEVISYPVVTNFQKLMTLKIADLLLGEPPQITFGDTEESPQNDTIKKISEVSDLNNTDYQAAIDVSRYGDGIFLVRKTDKGGIIDLTQPPIWFPVVNPDNVRETLYHVLAWTYEKTGVKYLKVQIHEKGKYTEREYVMNGNSIAAMVGEENIVPTGLSDNAVIPIHNVITSDRATGIDDYTDIDSIIADLMVRIGQIDRILDKHASPSMSGPASALEKDPVSGEYRIKAGNYFTRESTEDPAPGYIVWDGQLEANFKQVERLVNLLYSISEMGSALFGDMSTSTGQVPSGSALKRLMISPLAKTNRIRMRFDPAIKKAIALCSEFDGYTTMKPDEITITWKDGLPSDEKELADIMNIRTGQKATISQKTAIMRMDDVTAERAEMELEAILDDESMETPTGTAPFSTATPSEETDME